MTDQRPPSSPSSPPKKLTREEKLAEALRKNLRRRKEAAKPRDKD